MNRKNHFLLILFILFVPFFLFGEDAERDGGKLSRLAAEDLSAGRFGEALEKYEDAALLLSGGEAQLCLLRALQIRLDLGRYANLPAEAHPLVLEGADSFIVRGALLVEIKSLIRLGSEDRALTLMERHDPLLTGDPSSALGLSDAYRELGMEEQAKKAEWIIKRDFPHSPEGLILTGRAERRPKPSLILP